MIEGTGPCSLCGEQVEKRCYDLVCLDCHKSIPFEKCIAIDDLPPQEKAAQIK